MQAWLRAVILQVRDWYQLILWQKSFLNQLPCLGISGSISHNLCSGPEKGQRGRKVAFGFLSKLCVLCSSGQKPGWSILLLCFSRCGVGMTSFVPGAWASRSCSWGFCSGEHRGGRWADKWQCLTQMWGRMASSVMWYQETGRQTHFFLRMVTSGLAQSSWESGNVPEPTFLPFWDPFHPLAGAQNSHIASCFLQQPPASFWILLKPQYALVIFRGCPFTYCAVLIPLFQDQLALITCWTVVWWLAHLGSVSLFTSGICLHFINTASMEDR